VDAARTKVALDEGAVRRQAVLAYLRARLPIGF
jgi:hypothetical protein